MIQLKAESYNEDASILGLWRHKWHPIKFCLIMDNFGVEYVGIKHFIHLLNLLKKYHGGKFNMSGDKFAGINIKWDYANKLCQISMPGYVATYSSNSSIRVPASKDSCPTRACQTPVFTPSPFQASYSQDLPPAVCKTPAQSS